MANRNNSRARRKGERAWAGQWDGGAWRVLGSWGLLGPLKPLQPRQSRPMQAINGEHPTLKHLSSCWHLGTGHLALSSLHKWPWEPLIPAPRASMLGEMSGSAHH